MNTSPSTLSQSGFKRLPQFMVPAYVTDGSLEAEWLHIVLVAGVDAGLWILTGPQNTRYDAGKMTELWTHIKADPEKVMAIAKPQGVDVARWRKLFELLALPTGPLANDNTRAAAVANFQTRLAEKAAELVEIDRKLRVNLPALREESRVALDKTLAQIARAKSTLEGLQGLNSKAKMTNLNLSDEALGHLDSDLKAADGAARLLGLLATKKRELDALERFRSILEGESAFQAEYGAFEDAVNAAYADPSSSSALQSAEAQLGAAVERAVSTYSALKTQHSLDYSADKRKKELMQGQQLGQLNKLQGLAVLNRAALESVRQQVAALPTFKACTTEELLDSATSLCPHTGFDPRTIPEALRGRRASDVLADCEVAIDSLHLGWTAQLLGELSDPSTKPTLEALKSGERRRVDEFLRSRTLPTDLDAEWVRIVGEALRGLKRKSYKAGDFAKAVLGDGAPLKVDELRERFEKWLKEQTAQEAAESVRFVLED